MSDIWDDPTWCCDYKSRCVIPIIKQIIADIKKWEDCDIPHYKNSWKDDDIEYFDSIKKKWEKELKRCEEDDK